MAGLLWRAYAAQSHAITKELTVANVCMYSRKDFPDAFDRLRDNKSQCLALVRPDLA